MQHEDMEYAFPNQESDNRNGETSASLQVYIYAPQSARSHLLDTLIIKLSYSHQIGFAITTEIRLSIDTIYPYRVRSILLTVYRKKE